MIFIKQISKHKCLEIQTRTDLDDSAWFFDISFRKDRDHPGFYLSTSFGPLFLEFNIYDTRHKEDFEEKDENARPFRIETEYLTQCFEIVYATSKEEAEEIYKSQQDEPVDIKSIKELSEL